MCKWTFAVVAYGQLLFKVFLPLNVGEHQKEQTYPNGLKMFSLPCWSSLHPQLSSNWRAQSSEQRIRQNQAKASTLHVKKKAEGSSLQPGDAILFLAKIYASQIRVLQTD